MSGKKFLSRSRFEKSKNPILMTSMFRECFVDFWSGLFERLITLSTTKNPNSAVIVVCFVNTYLLYKVIFPLDNIIQPSNNWGFEREKVFLNGS